MNEHRRKPSLCHNETLMNPDEHICHQCNKIRARRILAVHSRRIHQGARKLFKYEKFNSEFRVEVNILTTRRTMGDKIRCGGETRLDALYICQTDISKSNIARHRRACGTRAGVVGKREEAMKARGGESDPD